MIDLGDLREGIFFRNEDEIFSTVEQILAMSNIKLYGIGVNLTCYGAIIPKNDNLSQLTDLGEKIEEKFDIKLQMDIRRQLQLHLSDRKTSASAGNQ